MFGKKNSTAKLQKEMRKYDKKMRKINRQLDKFNTVVELKSKELRGH